MRVAILMNFRSCMKASISGSRAQPAFAAIHLFGLRYHRSCAECIIAYRLRLCSCFVSAASRNSLATGHGVYPGGKTPIFGRAPPGGKTHGFGRRQISSAYVAQNQSPIPKIQRLLFYNLRSKSLGAITQFGFLCIEPKVEQSPGARLPGRRYQKQVT
jgi:hypothetical protein